MSWKPITFEKWQGDYGVRVGITTDKRKWVWYACHNSYGTVKSLPQVFSNTFNGPLEGSEDTKEQAMEKAEHLLAAVIDHDKMIEMKAKSDVDYLKGKLNRALSSAKDEADILKKLW